MLDDITIDLSGIEGLFDKHLPDPDLLEFYRNCNDRIIIWNNDWRNPSTFLFSSRLIHIRVGTSYGDGVVSIDIIKILIIAG